MGMAFGSGMEKGTDMLSVSCPGGSDGSNITVNDLHSITYGIEPNSTEM